MLLNDSGKLNAKMIAVLSRNPVFVDLIGGVLEEWGFALTEDLDEAAIIFAERGMDVPPHQCRLIWMSPMPIGDENYLEVPISLTKLYHLLEEEIFPSPRRHIRVSLNVSADIQLDGLWQEATLISLSDRGGRLICEQEIHTGKALTLQAQLAERTLHLPCEVLYNVPAGEGSRREKPHVGIYFKPLDLLVCQALRKFIEKECLRRACARRNISASDPGVSWIEMVRDPWSGLP